METIVLLGWPASDPTTLRSGGVVANVTGQHVGTVRGDTGCGHALGCTCRGSVSDAGKLLGTLSVSTDTLGISGL